jgi:PadR family transcriptional regulator, regulatory protein PadR
MLYRMSREALGEFEQLVLLAIIRLGASGAEAIYGVPIVDEIESRTKRQVARAAVYISLRRLEQKGLVSTWMAEPTQQRGGKSRRCVKITRAGLTALRESRQAVDQMWHGLDPRLEKLP